MLALAFLHGTNGSALAQTAAAATLKAAFLYNFAKFTEWPTDVLPPGQRLLLCVVGDNAVADALEETIKGRAHEGHELAVELMRADQSFSSCHLLYVDGREARRSAQVLNALKGATILSVGDAENFAEQGGIAQLILENNQMRFAINVTAVDRARLRLSSKLLGLATIVRN
jgi:hypothetical protein